MMLFSAKNGRPRPGCPVEAARERQRMRFAQKLHEFAAVFQSSPLAHRRLIILIRSIRYTTVLRVYTLCVCVCAYALCSI